MKVYNSLSQHDINMKIKLDTKFSNQEGYEQACVDIDKILNELTSYIFNGNITTKPNRYFVLLYSSDASNYYCNNWIYSSHEHDPNWFNLQTSVPNGASFKAYTTLITDVLVDRGFTISWSMYEETGKFNIFMISIDIVEKPKIFMVMQEQIKFLIDKIKANFKIFSQYIESFLKNF